MNFKENLKNLNTEELGNIGEEKIKYVLNLYLQKNAGYVINKFLFPKLRRPLPTSCAPRYFTFLTY